MENPVLITGCARSGTSLVAGVVHLSGAFGGDMVGPNQWNEKGQFENLWIREKLVKPYLEAIFADPKGQAPLPIASTVPIMQGWDEMFMEVLRAQGYKSGPFFYKGAKACLMWPVWHAAFPHAKWIITRRFTEDIVQSCLRTAFMNAYKDKKGWHRWIWHHEDCFKEMYESGLDIREIWTPDIVKGDLSELKKVIQWLDLVWDEKKVMEFICPEIWHGK